MYSINLEQHQLEQKGRHLYIDINISILCKYIADDGAIVLTPVLKDHEHSLELPLVIINGRQRHKCFKGMLRYFKPYHIYKALRGCSNSEVTCCYELRIPFEKWMNRAQISLMTSCEAHQKQRHHA
ncbi:DUF3868 domain-containing protein [Dysgonomonas sp. HGC4]|uniref:DUF3868 domain-containing protein n=1 Tax=Dysgonomonas sp. HGC4 TaxID=1658009 RepID=UPI0006815454|nr:DUF3868 domain-containing protein [Dysgonomonas sp. HGC4]MBD8347750.1 DUF3868 domain-containing protein [Dysgonomonas sp. HGC4]